MPRYHINETVIRHSSVTVFVYPAILTVRGLNDKMCVLFRRVEETSSGLACPAFPDSGAIGTKRGVLDFHFWLVDVSFADVESRFVRRIVVVVRLDSITVRVK